MNPLLAWVAQNPLLAIAIWFGVVFTIFGEFERSRGLRRPW